MTSLTRKIIENADRIRLNGELRVAIVGAGVSGVVMAHSLLRAGVTDFVIYEKAASVGGTWRENVYPGVACDVGSYLYSFTFYPNPNWSQSAAPGPEIRQYIEDAAKDLGILPHIRFHTQVTSSTYKDGRWEIQLSDGERDSADILISCAGFLHHPSVPNIPGLETFRGEAFHSSQWPRYIDLTDKRVANIGSGSSSVQIVSAIVDRVGALKVFQRTAQWILPLPRETYPPEQQQRLADNPGELLRLYDEALAEMDATYGSVTVGDEEQTRLFVEAATAFLATVKDPELRAKLTPQYQIMCKRLVMSADYYDAIQRANCELITAPIEGVEANGIRTADGILHQLDMIVLSTGYRARDFFRSIHPTGQNGVTLDDVWSDGVSTFESVALSKFPNFFSLGGPFSTVANQSFMTCAELQASYIIRLLKIREDEGARAVMPSEAAERRFARENAAGLATTPWLSGCQNWYFDGTSNFPFWTRHPSKFYELMNKGPDIDDYVFIK